MMTLVSRLENLLTPVLTERGLDLVRVQISGQQRPTLQVMIDRQDAHPVTLDDCTQASRDISALLNVEDPLEGSYRLEVTSPGLDRPLIKIKDFQRFVGSCIKLQTIHLKEGRKKFEGFLEKATDTEICVRLLDSKDCFVTFSYEELQQAKIKPDF